MRHKKILLLSYYFPPDLSAGSFRAQALQKVLSEYSSSTHIVVDVLTSSPSRYGSYIKPSKSFELHEGGVIKRLQVPFFGKSLVFQSLRHVCFSLSVLWQVRKQHYDVVVATSSRLMTAVLGLLVAKQKGARLYLDIRDIFTDTIDNVFRSRLLTPLKGVLKALERGTLNRADKINYVSEGFVEYFNRQGVTTPYSCFPNGVDEVFSQVDWHMETVHPERPKVLYAGNVGEGQGLDKVLPYLAQHYQDVYDFVVIGDGACLPLLKSECIRLGVANIGFYTPVSRSALLDFYDSSEVLYLQLNDYDAFERVLPSKLFEYAATHKPILAGVSGFAESFIKKEVSGVAVFEPGNITDAISALKGLSNQEPVDRSAFCQKFSRRHIMTQMSQDILKLLSKRIEEPFL